MTFQPDIYGKVLDLIPNDPSLRIFDVGAGQGHFSSLLRARGQIVEACDFLPDDFRCPDVPFVRSNLNESIPCESDRYDYVVSIEVIEHLENHFAFMRELIRVTKPGGRIIVTTPNVLGLTSRIRFLLTGFTDCAHVPIDPYAEDVHLQHINPIGLSELLFHFERNGAELETLTTNRFRRSAWPWLVLYPLLAWNIRRQLLKNKLREHHALHRRHIRWIMTPVSLLGRITIAVARKQPAP